ncbi:hypothetical protein V8E36_005972 [Tilletia maclaganii]
MMTVVLLLPSASQARAAVVRGRVVDEAVSLVVVCGRSWLSCCSQQHPTSNAARRRHSGLNLHDAQRFPASMPIEAASSPRAAAAGGRRAAARCGGKHTTRPTSPKQYSSKPASGLPAFTLGRRHARPPSRYPLPTLALKSTRALPPETRPTRARSMAHGCACALLPLLILLSTGARQLYWGFDAS